MLARQVSYIKYWTEKMKYRIIVTDSTAYPYRVQKKERSFSLFWKDIGGGEDITDAEEVLRKYIRAKIPKVGTIIKTYDESDLIVEKLKGTI